MSVRTWRICSFLFLPVVLTSAGSAAFQNQAPTAARPRISDVRTSFTDQGEWEIRWHTNRPTRWVLRHGVGRDLDQVKEGVELRTSHSTLVAPGGESGGFRFELIAEDDLGVESFPTDSGQDTGPDPEPDVLPPTLVALRPFFTTETGTDVTLLWITDENVFSVLEYGPTSDYGTTINLGFPSTFHTAVLDDLQQGTNYHFRVTMTDFAGNVTTSDDDSFLAAVAGGAEITGTRNVWFPLTFTFKGPFASERDVSPNPFLDYRTSVTFLSPTGQQHVVPGFFAGDGAGFSDGDFWRACFVPDEPGEWLYLASFVSGPGIAIDPNQPGTPSHFDSVRATFQVGPRDPNAPGFHRYGRLEYVGEHYLKFRDGPYFIKTGTNSPENLFGYIGIDNTVDQGGSSTGLPQELHAFPGHVADFGEGGLGGDDDPFFESITTGHDSLGLIGALNYLADSGVNSVYFLPMNLGGDGQDTAPFIGFENNGYDDTHYDISKLDQWTKVMEHANRRGIFLHVVLNEIELGNRVWLDNGILGTERKLFYRELVARFSHCLGLQWNISEENAFSPADTLAFAQYIRSLDPYDHPVGFHTLTLPPNGDSFLFTAFLGNENISYNSIQSNIGDVGSHVERWRADTAAAGRKWVVSIDEVTTPLTDSNAFGYRQQVLYDTLFSGGNVEFYFGAAPLPLGGDLETEDFRTREQMWTFARHARTFMETHLPFWEMDPHDELVTGEALLFDGGGAEVFAKPGNVYAIYYPTSTQTGTIDLTGHTGSFFLRWWNPHVGRFSGPVRILQGGGVRPMGAVPSNPLGDWVALLER